MNAAFQTILGKLRIERLFRKLSVMMAVGDEDVISGISGHLASGFDAQHDDEDEDEDAEEAEINLK